MLLFILVLGVILIIGKDRLFQEKTKQSSIVEALPDFLSQLSKHWRIGDLERLEKFSGESCGFLKNLDLDESQLACNPLYFDCLLKDMAKANFSDFRSNSLNFIPQLEPTEQYLSESAQFVSLNIYEKQTNKIFKVRLQKSCDQKKLPVNKYSAGPQIESSYIWDNYSYNVFIDRDYISRYEIWNWASQKGKLDLVVSMGDKDKLFTPALNLPLDTQKEYCQDQGKNLLESRFFDAATFYPSREQNIYKYPFPWTKARNTFLNNESSLTPLNCQNAYVSECSQYSKSEKKSFTSVSWIGVYHSLGNYSESFRNVFNPDANLKVSNKNLSRTNPWHRVGLRGHWSGEGINPASFQFIEQYTGRLIELKGNLAGIAFRCMDLR